MVGTMLSFNWQQHKTEQIKTDRDTTRNVFFVMKQKKKKKVFQKCFFDIFKWLTVS